MAFTPDGHTLTVVVDREEMSVNSGHDTIFDWPVIDSGALGAVTAAAGDVADFQLINVAVAWQRASAADWTTCAAHDSRRKPTSAGNTEPATRRTGCTVASSDEGTGSAVWSRAAGRKGEFGR